MQQSIIKYGAKISAFLVFVLTGLAVQAQDKIEIDTEEIGTWFERNWMWVAVGAVLLFLLIILVSRRRNTNSGDSRRTTTIIKDAQGNTKSVTTTEEKL